MHEDILRRQIGRAGENQARKFLINNGYKIIAQNYRVMQCGEIDIIAEDGDVLVIVEVKKRTNKDFNAGDAITKSKQKRLARTAEVFINENFDKYNDKPVRFDVVLINENKLEIVKDAFMIY